MKYKTLKLCIVLLLGLGLSGLQAQENVNPTGGDASGSGGSVSYTVGQVVYTTNTGTSGSVAQGVQQPFEISVFVGIEEANVIKLSVSAYPNPTSDYLTLSTAEFDESNPVLSKVEGLSYQLYDIKGKLLQTKILTGTETQIDMRNYIQSTYFVKVIQGKSEIKTFKIIKN